jgi:hypothetical protein
VSTYHYVTWFGDLINKVYRKSERISNTSWSSHNNYVTWLRRKFSDPSAVSFISHKKAEFPLMTNMATRFTECALSLCGLTPDDPSG